jgi:lysozyme
VKLDLAADLCRHFEGFSSKPYICPAGYATIGYGTVYKPGGEKVTMQHLPISKALAEEWLMHELRHTYAPGVLRACPAAAVNERVFNALVDFCYNLGVGRLQTSTLRRVVNAGDWQGAKEQLMRWTRGGGRVLPGLVRRRAAEVALFDGGPR